MKITIVCVGKVKEKYLRDAISEYEKRLSRYCRLQVIEVADEKTPDGASAVAEDQIREKEAERILKNLRSEDPVVTLEIEGKQVDSVSFAQKIEQMGVEGVSHIQFVIGGSLGLHEKVSKVSGWKLSFSKMTFPHQLMRVILLEQIYRGYRIINGEPYHK